MGRGPLSFKKTDFNRAVDAARAKNLPIASIEVDTKSRTLRLIIGEPSNGGPSKGEPVNDLDQELAEFEARNAQG